MTQTEKTGPTPGPWFVDEHDPHSIYGPDGDDPWFIAEAAYDCGPDGTPIANAAHIVKCVNAHPELVAALEGAAVVLGMLPVPDDMSHELRAGIDKRCKAVTAALSNLEPQP
jgi:hypothetical protein